MTDHENKADERDEDNEGDRDSDPPSERKPAAKAKPGAGSGAAKPAIQPAAKPAGMGSGQVGLLLVLALAAGGAAGWFGHIAQAKAALRADSTAPTSDSGPCGNWSQKICSTSGKQSAVCQQAKGAADLLTPLTCEAGLLAMPATLAKVKAARTSCDKLVAKLCGDLPPDSQTCAMVKERTPQFPSQQCDEMLQHYDEVIGQLKQMDQAQAKMGGHGGPGGPGMSAPGGPGAGPGPVVVSPP